MNCVIDNRAGAKKNIRPRASRKRPKYSVRSGCDDPAARYSLREASLPWEILEAAHALFQKKGFERTSVLDICSRLKIKSFEFYNHFNSLDEVLEILWAR